MSEHLTVARPYARAAFELAQSQEAFDEWSKLLFGGALMIQDSQFMNLIRHPKFSDKQTIDWMDAILKDVIHAYGLKFFELLAKNQRLLVLPEIFELYEVYRKRALKAVQAFVSSAQPLTEQDKDKIRNALKARLGAQQVELICEIDESLMAGAVIQANDLVIDGSVKGRLSRLGEVLGV